MRRRLHQAGTFKVVPSCCPSFGFGFDGFEAEAVIASHSIYLVAASALGV